MKAFKERFLEVFFIGKSTVYSAAAFKGLC